MKLITRDTDYALRALCYLERQHGKQVSVSQLVAALKMPRPFLRKILQVLNREGILISARGQGGGFQLRTPVQKVFLLDLMRIFQGELELNECTFKKSPCPKRDVCGLRRKIKSIERRVADELRRISVASIVGG